jgi:hypothetical protein
MSIPFNRLRLAASILVVGVALTPSLAGCTPTVHNGHTGDPVTYAGAVATPASSVPGDVDESDVTADVMQDLSDDPQLAGITTTRTPAGLKVVVTLTRNDERVPDVWLADLAVGAVAERSRTNERVANDLVSTAIAVGPDAQGNPVTTSLGIGAVQLGQVFGSPSDSVLAAHVVDVAKNHGLMIADLRILHPLESALSVTFVVPDGARIDWTIDQLRAELAGAPPDLEGVFIELRDSKGQPLLQSGAAYRTGEGGLWFAPGQDSRFGAVHSGTPLNVGS